MIPRSPSPSEPLLGHSSTRSQPTPTALLPARRTRRLVVLLVGPLVLVITLFALAETNQRTREAVAPYRQRIDRFLYRAAVSVPASIAISTTTTTLSQGESTATKAEDAPVASSTAKPAPARVEENTDLAPLPRRKWSKEDKQLRRYAWKTPPIHSSLERMLADLSPAQIRTRQWLLESRNLTMGGTGIGLGASDPPERIRPALALPSHPGELPHELAGPGVFSTGSYQKYFDLVQEWQTGRPVDSCKSHEWEDTYTALHSRMLAGQQPPRLLEFFCRAGEYCGGFADRILGMTTMLLYSVMTNRAFSVTWEQPAPVDLFFDSPHIDWSRPYSAASKTPPNSRIYTDKQLIRNRTEINAHNWEPEHIDEFMPNFVNQFDDGRNTSWLRVDFNRGVVMRSFGYEAVKPHLDKLGLKMNTAYSCLIKYLLRPKPAVLAFISQYTSFFALPENFVIGIQIRTGDLSMWTSKVDANNTVKQHSQYFTCADAVARTYAHPSQKVVYYLITDSRVLERDALRKFGDRVVVTGLKQAHVEIKTDTSTGMKAIRRAADGFMRTIAESWIFAGTDFQIITQRSGFGKIPTWLRGRENTTIPLFNAQTDPEYTQDYRDANDGNLPPEIDCSQPYALKSFHEMAQEWSLG